MNKIKAVFHRIGIESRSDIIPLIWIIAGILIEIWYQVMFGQDMLDSDMSAEMVLSNLLNSEHSITGLTTSWLYGNELRAFQMQWLYRIGLALFPFNWHLARTFSMMLAVILLAFAVWMVFYSIDAPKLGLWAAAACVFPGGAWYFWQSLYGGYYLTYIYITLFSLGFAFLAIKNSGRLRSKIYFILVVLIGVASGMNGVRQMMVFYAPWVLSGIAVLIFDIRMEKEHTEGKIDKSKINDPIFMLKLSFAGAIGAFTGYLFNNLYLSKIYSFRYWGDETLIARSFLTLLKDFIWSYGYNDDKVLMSFNGIAVMSGVVVGLTVVLSAFLMLLWMRKIPQKMRMLGVFLVINIFFYLFILSYLTHGDPQYLQPIVPIGYMLLFLIIYNSKVYYRYSKLVLNNIMMVLICLASIGTIRMEADGPAHPYCAEPNLNRVVYQLKDDYDQGVAWSSLASMITELSDGKIDAWAITSELEEDNMPRFLPYLQKADHLERYPEGKYFYIVSNPYMEGGYGEVHENFLKSHPELDKIIYQDGEYTVWATE